MPGEDFHRGVMLAPGIYASDGELHVDADEYIVACGGNPASQADRDTAARVVARVCGLHGIEFVEVER
jgi:hypothetical protein